MSAWQANIVAQVCGERLDIYLRGRGAVSCFAEAALGRALSDVTRVISRLGLLTNLEGTKTRECAKAAIERQTSRSGGQRQSMRSRPERRRHAC